MGVVEGEEFVECLEFPWLVVFLGIVFEPFFLSLRRGRDRAVVIEEYRLEHLFLA